MVLSKKIGINKENIKSDAEAKYILELAKQDIEKATNTEVYNAYNFFENKEGIKQEVIKQLEEDIKILNTKNYNGYEPCIYLTESSYKKYNDAQKDSEKITEHIENNKLAQAEELIAKWSCVDNEKDGDTQSLLKIDRYYDLYTGMTPYVEIYFRTGITKNKEKNEAVWTNINSIEHPFISNVSIKDNGVKTVTIELYDKDFASYTKFPVRKNSSFMKEGGDPESDYYSLDQLIKTTLRNDFSMNNIDYEDKGAKQGVLKYETTYLNQKTKEKEKISINYNEQNFNDINIKTYQGFMSKEEKNEIISKFKDWKKNQKVKKTNFFYEDEASKNKDPNVETQIDGEYLKLIEDNSILSPTNLKIRFGYADYNAFLNENSKLDQYFKDKGSEGRSNRWWDVANDFGEDWSVSLNTYMDENGEIASGPIDLETAGHKLYNSEGKSLSVKHHMRAVDQTTQMSREISLMITGYNSTLTANGIKYTITAIESKEARLMKTRYLQRFSEIVDYPEGVLYSLMRMFNEYGGKSLSDKKIKIVFMQDDKYDKNNLTNKLLVQKYDLKSLTEEERKKVTYTDTFNAIRNGESIKADLLAKISLSLGSETSLSNYRDISERPPLTKSVAALIDEFCAACPAKKIEQTIKKVYNEDGEEVKIDPTEQTARPLKWFSAELNGVTYIVLYYRKQLKPEKIRQYNWGPNLPYNTCIKQINIQNKNEFALLSSVRTFNSSNGTIQSRINNENINNSIDETEAETVTEKTKIDKILDKGGTFDIVADSDITAEAYDIALSSGVYEGSIDILGDPFFLFNGVMQPCTYPIRLNVLVPKNETEMRTTGNDKKTIEEKHKKFGTGNVVENSNQRFHEMSGYYVVKDIEHNISPNGFATKLNILSYPNITKQILYGDGTKNPIEEGKNY